VNPQSTSAADLTRVFRQARRDPGLVVLEGLHALKHAVRFGAHVTQVAITAPAQVRAVAAEFAPDLLRDVLPAAQTVGAEVFQTLAPAPPSTGVIAIAVRPRIDVDALLADPRPAPVVLLERSSDLGNIGACVRVAAAADAAGVLTLGGIHDPWDPAALRGSAGLHFALGVARLAGDSAEALGALEDGPSAEPPGGLEPTPPSKPGGPGGAGRPLVAVDPDGEPLRPERLPPRAILAFGAERHGLSDELLARADARVSLPMRTGVSSLNLATSVAALLYGWRLAT
jgi:TrmH family RNA methyltransferase